MRGVYSEIWNPRPQSQFPNEGAESNTFELKNIYRTLAIINRGYYWFKPLILMKLYLKNEVKNKN